MDLMAAKLHTLMLDAMTPIMYILEKAQKGTLSMKSATEAAKAALMLLGKVLAHSANERRKNELNKNLLRTSGRGHGFFQRCGTPPTC